MYWCGVADLPNRWAMKNDRKGSQESGDHDRRISQPEEHERANAEADGKVREAPGYSSQWRFRRLPDQR
jgi:hypothetical protein